MKKSFITLFIITLLATPCFAAGKPGNAPPKKPPVVQRQIHHNKMVHHRRHARPCRCMHRSTVVVDYNVAGKPYRVSSFGPARYVHQRFYL